MQVHPSIDIDLDKVPSEFKIGHEIFKYAFENAGKDEQFIITSDVSMKLIFFSRKEGILLKNPHYDAFFLTQDKFLLEEIDG